MMTYYKVVKVLDVGGGGYNRTSVIRGGDMKMYYARDSWTTVPIHFAEIGCGLFVYDNKAKLIQDILDYGWAVDNWLEIWEVEPDDNEMYHYPNFRSITEAECGILDYDYDRKLEKGVHIFGAVKLIKRRAVMNKDFWKKFYIDDKYRLDCIALGKAIDELLERSSEMNGSIRYEHYRPRLGTLPGTKGSTPDAVLFRYSRGYKEFEPDPKGGKTICTITLPGGQQYVGVANCSQSDCFCFSEGRAWALKYALEALLEEEPEGELYVEDGKLRWTMPLEDGKTIARYLKSFLNNTKVFSDNARNELYKALNNVEVFGLHGKD